jgi:hypothetical protein
MDRKIKLHMCTSEVHTSVGRFKSGFWLGSGVSGLGVQIFSETRFGSRPKVLQIQNLILRTVVVPEVLSNPIKEN